MNHKRTLSLTEARKRIFKIADEVQAPDTHYTLTEKGVPRAVIMSVEEYESMMETLEVAHQFPNLDRDIKEAEEEFKRGELVPLEDVQEKEGYVSRSAIKKGQKRTKKGR